MLTFDIAGAQIDGARDYQEDAFLITRLGDSTAKTGVSLLIVADGMGGHAAGNVASNMAVQTFNKHMTGNFPSTEMSKVLRQAMLQANTSISDTVRETAALRGMGCTLIAAILEDQQLRWVSVGDSHLYIARGTELLKQNADHSYGGFLARMAAMGKPVEPESGFARNMLMSALTGEEIAEIDCPEDGVALQAGDRLLLASDGLDTLAATKILALLARNASAKECVDAILLAVADARMPRQDNATVIVVTVTDQAEFKPRAAPAAPLGMTDAIPHPAMNRPLQRPPTVPIARPPRKPEKSKAPLMIGGLVLVAALAGAGWWMTKPTASKPPESVVSTPSPTPGKPATNENQAPSPVESAPQPTATPPRLPAAANGSEHLRDGAGPEMVRVPGGAFLMGSAESVDVFAGGVPQHEVQVGRFAISAREVTVAEYGRFAGGKGGKASLPVTFVSWDQAVAYTQWLSRQTGKRYRLPTEAEWEYAARGGSTTPYWWGRELGQNQAQCFACESSFDPRKPAPVGSFKPNAFGLYDTVGNVEEWVLDCPHESYEGAPTDGGVFGGGDCTKRVVRGGAFSSGPNTLRASSRNRFARTSGNDGIGFRVVREP